MAEKCLLIGLGQIGMGYDLGSDSTNVVYTHAKAFFLHSSFELSGAVDPESGKRKLFEENFGCPSYPTIASALQALSPSVVVIATPTEQHHLNLREVLANSTPKIILCEKPLAYDIEEASQMVEACESVGVRLFVNYMRRAEPGAIEIKARIESGQIEVPIKGVVWYSKGFLHNGSHFFNLLEFWLGPFLKATILDAGRLWDCRDPEPDVQVDFELGRVIFMAAWEEAFSHYTIELLSTSGRLRYDQGGELITWQSTQVDSQIAGYEVLQRNAETISNEMNRYQWHVVNNIAIALTNGQHTLSTGKQSLKTLEAMHQIINQR